MIMPLEQITPFLSSRIRVYSYISIIETGNDN